jgi:hypothetical protein
MEQHREAAAAERAASLRDFEAADRESEKARLESQRLAQALEDSSPQAQHAGTESLP